MKRWLWMLLLCAGAAQAQEQVAHGRFDDVMLYRPAGEPQSFVLFLSDADGGDAPTTRMMRTLVARGALVAGINTRDFFAAMEADGAPCQYADGDLENLSHFLQAYAQVPGYLPPLLAGKGVGASFAYAVLAQAPKGMFAGALALGFTRELPLHQKTLCELPTAQARADGSGLDLLPAARLSGPLRVLHGEADDVAPLAGIASFMALVPQAQTIPLPNVGHGFGNWRDWQALLGVAYEELVAPIRPAMRAPAGDVADLPVIELPVQQSGDSFALIISGDGGWAGLDKNLASALLARGIPVVGLDSLRYFWSPRTPEGVAHDVERLIRHYSARWQKKRVLLIGYSQGGDVLPFAYNRLSPAVRAQVALAVPISISDRAAFEFHMTNWVGGKGDVPTMPEMDKLAGNSTLFCVYGADDKESLCSQLDPKRFRVKSLPGAHHFNGDYAKLAATVLEALPKD
ncbi:MAG TPA: AcvB/VirJ family lysyl-phosphatidylglycerol hydrolase [Nevskiaceae bacterium]|nr:AcvB/VirJ family lysyl-phosphatidylglycerol hydrolase [Nevskiaceae bacterium]